MSLPGEGSDAPRRALDGLDWGRTAGGVAGEEPAEPEAHAPPPLPDGGEGGERTWRTTALVALVALVAATVGGAVGGGVVAIVKDDGSSTAASTAAAGPAITVPLTTAISEAAAKARLSVIKIQSTKRTPQGTEEDVGSGVVLDSAGHILTNAHVVLETSALKVILADGSERAAILIGDDFPYTDLAVLQISPGNLTPMEVGDSGGLVLGETVVAVGNPLSEFTGSVSMGVVSGLGRQQVFDGVQQNDLIQTDTAVNNGNSGGALVNLRGQLVGMPTAVLRQTRNGTPVEGIAFALPANRILEIARGIIQAAGAYPRPALGVTHIDLTPEVLARLRGSAVDQGALVTDVQSGGPAAAAGVLPGDIITRVGDQDVNRGQFLFNALARFAPGQVVRVVLNRGGRIIEAEVRLARKT
ncbi:MAG: trypsin-like peptidase domain-containing protein [Dehalococcoidia bacterium]|nr:trypsin-like peptidase domain-containing protein [Dehalococcoidia bacterium]